MSKTIELTESQFNILMMAVTSTSLRYGQALEAPGIYSYLVGVKSSKDDIDGLIEHLTSNEAPGVKSVDLAKSIIDKKGREAEPEGGE